MQKCLYCGKDIPITTNSAHRKYCSRKCSRRHYYIRNKKHEQDGCKRWYQANRKSELAKNKEYRKQNRELFDWYHNKKRFGGLRDGILKRDNNICQICGSPEKLNIHHIDGNGYKNKTPHNTIDNLITLCSSCHTKLHHWQRKNHVLKNSEDIVRTMGKLIEV